MKHVASFNKAFANPKAVQKIQPLTTARIHEPRLP
jgi:hypothetical protein